MPMDHNIDFSLGGVASKPRKSLHQGVTGFHEDVESRGNSSDDEAHNMPEDMADYVSRMEYISKHLKKFVEYLRPTRKNVHPLDVKSILKDFQTGSIVLESDNPEAAVNEKRLDDEVLPEKARVAKTLPGELRLEDMMNCIVQVADLGIDNIFDVTSDAKDKRAFTILNTVLEISDLPMHRQSDLFLYMQTIGNALYTMTPDKNKRDSTSFVYTVSALSIMAEMTTRAGYVPPSSQWSLLPALSPCSSRRPTAEVCRATRETDTEPEPADFFLSFNTLRQYFIKNNRHMCMLDQICQIVK